MVAFFGVQPGMGSTSDAPPPRWCAVCAIVFAAALALRLIYASTRPVPMAADAAYYVMVAENLYAGRGLVADYLWNYLAGLPDGLPVPSNGYWMPGTSAAMWAAFAAARGVSLRAAQWPSLLFGALVCALTAHIAGALSRRRDAALLAGAAAALNLYLVELSLYPDHFMLNAALVNLSLLALWSAWRGGSSPALLSGALAGLAYLTRTDAGLLIPVALIAALWLRRRVRRTHGATVALLFVVGFVLVALPWWTRQLVVFGNPSGSNPVRTAFVTSYDDLFRLDQSRLTLEGYLDSSQVVQLGMKGYALYRSLRLLLKALVLFAVLAPMAFLLSDVRREAAPWALYLGLALLVPPALTPYTWLKGAMWHLMPALVPGLLALGSVAAVRAFDALRARNRSALGVALLAAALAAPAYWWLAMPGEEHLGRPLYPAAAQEAVQALGPNPAALTDNAWGLYHVARIPCAQFPSDGAEAALTVARAIGAEYVITRSDATQAAPSLSYMREIAAHPRFRPLARYPAGEQSLLVYRILPPGG